METLKVALSIFAALFIWTLVAADKLWALTLRDVAEAIAVAAITSIPVYYLYSLLHRRGED